MFLNDKHWLGYGYSSDKSYMYILVSIRKLRWDQIISIFTEGNTVRQKVHTALIIYCIHYSNLQCGLLTWIIINNNNNNNTYLHAPVHTHASTHIYTHHYSHAHAYIIINTYLSNVELEVLINNDTPTHKNNLD